MLFQKINMDSADKVFITCKNGVASRHVVGAPLCFDTVTDANGNTVIVPSTVNLRLFAGILADRIMGTSGQADQYQKVQTYGWNPSIMVGDTIAPGAPLVVINAATGLTAAVLHFASTAANITETYAYVVAGTTAASAAFGLIRGFIRAM